MEFLGIGPMELFFIILIAIIILGPRDMVKAGRTIGRFLRDIMKSDYYRAFMSSSREIRDLPTRLIREANLEDDLKEVDRLMRSTAAQMTTNTIHPPRAITNPSSRDSGEGAAPPSQEAEQLATDAAETGEDAPHPANKA
jgi:Sec-independent protein translocase protein TatA